MPQRPSSHKKFDLSAAWSYGPLTSQWERLWRLILSNTISESRLKEEEPSRERPTDGV